MTKPPRRPASVEAFVGVGVGGWVLECGDVWGLRVVIVENCPQHGS